MPIFFFPDCATQILHEGSFPDCGLTVPGLSDHAAF